MWVPRLTKFNPKRPRGLCTCTSLSCSFLVHRTSTKSINMRRGYTRAVCASIACLGLQSRDCRKLQQFSRVFGKKKLNRERRKEEPKSRFPKGIPTTWPCACNRTMIRKAAGLRVPVGARLLLGYPSNFRSYLRSPLKQYDNLVENVADAMASWPIHGSVSWIAWFLHIRCSTLSPWLGSSRMKLFLLYGKCCLQAECMKRIHEEISLDVFPFAVFYA